MRLKVTHMTVGMYHEVCFVCSADEEEYFKKVMQALEEEHALKSCLYVYDRDPLEGAIKRRLAHCYFVLFAITPYIINRAVTDENDAFRRVYGYVNSVNQSSISLMAVGSTGFDNSTVYPKEMQSMYWLHRKQIRTGYFSPNLIAAELYAELRRHHQRRDKLYLEKQAQSGVSLYRSLYGTMKSRAMWLFLLLLVGTGWVVFTLLGPAAETWPWYIEILNFFGVLAGIVSIPLSGTLFFAQLNERDKRLDVSSVFKDFKRLTVRRLCFGVGVISAAALGMLVFTLIGDADTTRVEMLGAVVPTKLIQLTMYSAVLMPLAVYFLKTVLFCRRLNKLTTDGAGFLAFAGWRWKMHLLFAVLMVVGALLGTQMYLFFV